jgi:transglutaminase-like putative cysteine protease
MLGSIPTVQQSTIAWGDQGVMQTLAAMSGLVHQGMASPAVIETARSLALYGGNDPRTQAQAIRHWMTRVFRFVPDPVSAEHLTDADYLLSQLDATGVIVGDCDDAAVLGASLGEAVGIPATWTVIAFDEGEATARYSHVYASLLTGPNQAIDLDITRPSQGSVAPVVRSLTVAV